MDVKNCKECGRLFNYIGGQRLCPECRSKLEDKFAEVKKYIDTNKGASISTVSMDMDVSIPQLHQWIREERLNFTEDSAVTLDCEICGTAIRTGRYCEKCKSDMSKNLGGLYKQDKLQVKKDEREKARMRFLDN
jgi:flagellar operon protein (TIGR03826 family)